MEAKDYLKDITDIREMMSRSTQFISLSGLSGVLAGLYAFAGAYAATIVLHRVEPDQEKIFGTLTLLLVAIAAGVALLSIITALLLTYSKASKRGETIWNPVSRRLLINFFIPLATGGAFVLQLILNADYGLIGPSLMIFYGLACVNASKYTLRDVRWLGVTIVTIGLVSVSFPQYAIEFMALGFGACHILYGLLMHFNYDRK